jgi:ElaB/YqjD/DUF883 family membrane-anchored ribosome-binding protein
MNETADKTTDSNTIARTVDHAAQGMHAAINTASNAAVPVVEQLAAGAHQATDKLSGAALHAAETLTQKSRQARDVEARFAESCRTHVRENPVASLGIAVAAGFALSWWLRRGGDAKTNE